MYILGVIAWRNKLSTPKYQAVSQMCNCVILTCYSDQAPHKRRELLFNTLILSITVYFVSVLGQSFIELAVLWLRDRERVARLALWYQVAQIAAFADPLLNPILVTLRTPLLQRKVSDL